MIFLCHCQYNYIHNKKRERFVVVYDLVFITFVFTISLPLSKMAFLFNYVALEKVLTQETARNFFIFCTFLEVCIRDKLEKEQEVFCHLSDKVILASLKSFG